MPDPVRSALIDASALIGYIKGEAEFACLRSLFTAVDRAEITLVESTAILIEVLSIHDDDLTAVSGVALLSVDPRGIEPLTSAIAKVAA